MNIQQTTVRCDSHHGDEAEQPSVEEIFLAVDGKRLEEVYRDRARQFATRATSAIKTADSRPAIAFTVGGERLGIATSDVAEVLRFDNCSPIPGARPELLGVINVRGRICSVIDLAQILELPRHGDAPRGHVVLIRHSGVEVGLRVDEVEQIEQVSPSQLAGPEGNVGHLATKYVQGRTPERLAVLDVDAVLSHPVFHGGRSAQSSAITSSSADKRQVPAPPALSHDRSFFGGVSV